MTNYITAMSQHAKDIYKDYIESFQIYHFRNDTLDTEERFIKTILGELRNTWQELNVSTNITHSSRKAYKTIKRCWEMNSQNTTSV